MNDKTKIDNEFEQAQSDARQAAKKQVNITKLVRDITLQALTKGKLETPRIKQVVQAVMEGVSLGAAEKGSEVKETLKSAITGLDEALTKSAMASKLAIDEAMGSVKNFGNTEINTALNDVKELEGLLFDTITRVAKSSGSVVNTTLSDILTHLKQTGSSAGKASADIVADLTGRLSKTTQTTAVVGTGAAKTFAVHVAEVAAGLLSGLADSINPNKKTKK